MQVISPDTQVLARLDREGLFRRVLQSIQDYAIFLLTPEGVIATWNSGAQRIKGYAPDEAIGRNFSMFYPTSVADSGWPAEELRRACEQGRLEDEGWRIRKDGSRFWANVVITALFDSGGTLLGFCKVTRDLTDRRLQAERLRESEENLRLLVEGVRGHAIFALCANGQVRSWNAGAQRVLGYAQDDIVGHDADVFYTEEDCAAGRPHADLLCAQRAGFAQSEGWRVRADGSRLWVDTTVAALNDADGHVTGYVQIMRDLSEQLRVQELETEGRRIQEFIAMLSHELRNPLAPIANAVRVLEQSGQGRDVAWSADLIGRQLSHLTRLVDDLLDVSRITGRKIRLQRAPLELNTLVQLSLDSVRTQIDAGEHQLQVQPALQPIFVLGDATRLTQVVTNLLSNAAKYTPRGGSIQVVLERNRKVATLQVTDNGIGMSMALMRRAFDPFVQGHRGLERAEGGLGIGLTLVKSIVEMHGGTVAVASAGPNQGTTFTVSLPLSSMVAPAEAPEQGRAAEGKREKVLLVDDNVDAAESLAMLLRMAGHEVVLAHDGPNALALAQSERPGVMLLDLGLPGMDGFQVAQRLRQAGLMPPLRLIALTGYGQTADRKATAEAGFQAHLVKPVDFDELARLIA